ncbi:YdhH/YoaO family protein, partial [Bacillus haynesii]
ELDSKIETPMKDYSGGTFKNGGQKEKSVSFLEFTELSQLEGHTITVYIKWRQGDKSYDTQFTLEKKS